jgi:protein N-terminal methyltransferase
LKSPWAFWLLLHVTHLATCSIGRVTTGLLTSIADKVDVIEPVAKFTASLEGNPDVGNIFNTGLEYWEPLPDVIYDLIWIQWCATYLDDESLIKFLERCMSVLNPDQGVIVVKENLSSSGEDFTEEYDGSVTRSASTSRSYMSVIRLTETQQEG